MGLKLTPGLTYCQAGGDLVFLDLTRDRYFCLKGNDRIAFEALCGARPVSAASQSRLTRSGLLIESADANSLGAAWAAVPVRDIYELPPSNAGQSSTMTAAASLFWGWRAAKTSRLSHSINTLRIRRDLLPDGPEAPVVEAAHNFNKRRAIMPFAQRCLPQSLALFHFLLRRRLKATLVFGVRTQPFAAHCWMQSPGYILTGTADEARNFTPILVV